MRKFILLLMISVISLTQISAQVKDGKLIFERKINMHKMITDPEMRRNIPEFRTESFELIFNDQATVFKTLPNEDAPDPFANSGGGGGGGGRMSFMFRMPETNTYTDIASQMQYEARTIFENEYLIIDTLKPNSWKLSDETKTIANYVCKKATTKVAPVQFSMRFGGGGDRGGDRRGRNNEDTTNQADRKPKELEVVVWYTESIPLAIGPDTYSGLPGAILEVDTDNGSNIISAVKYNPKYTTKELKQPTKGKKVNRSQFQVEMQDIMKGMQRGGGMGGFRISSGG